LGLILCLLGEVGASAETLRRAGEVDVRNLRTDAIMALVLGQQALGDVNFKHGKALRLSKARWAMYLAAVIAIEGEKGKTRVREELPKARGLFDRDQPPDPAEIVLERLLEIQ
jgi:hypothetical protein